MHRKVENHWLNPIPKQTNTQTTKDLERERVQGLVHEAWVGPHQTLGGSAPPPSLVGLVPMAPSACSCPYGGGI